MRHLSYGAARHAWRLCTILIALGGISASARSGTAGLLDRLPAAWLDDTGRPVQLADLRGERMVVTMAYASCRRICPLTLARLEELQRDIDARADRAQFVVVGYDPINDDPAVWHRYRRRHGLLRDNWHFLTGSKADTARFARLMGFSYWNYDEHLMHDYRIVVLRADGTLVGAVDSMHGELRDLL